MNRDELGRLVRETWVKYCIETGDVKPSHLLPYDALSEWDKEADRRIGEAVASETKQRAACGVCGGLYIKWWRRVRKNRGG